MAWIAITTASPARAEADRESELGRCLMRSIGKSAVPAPARVGASDQFAAEAAYEKRVVGQRRWKRHQLGELPAVLRERAPKQLRDPRVIALPPLALERQHLLLPLRQARHIADRRSDLRHLIDALPRA